MNRSDRLNMRIDPKLKQQMQEYCRRRHTTVSDLVCVHFARLLEEEKEAQAAKKKPYEAEQI